LTTLLTAGDLAFSFETGVLGVVLTGDLAFSFETGVLGVVLTGDLAFSFETGVLGVDGSLLGEEVDLALICRAFRGVDRPVGVLTLFGEASRIGVLGYTRFALAESPAPPLGVFIVTRAVIGVLLTVTRGLPFSFFAVPGVMMILDIAFGVAFLGVVKTFPDCFGVFVIFGDFFAGVFFTGDFCLGLRLGVLGDFLGVDTFLGDDLVFGGVLVGVFSLLGGEALLALAGCFLFVDFGLASALEPVLGILVCFGAAFTVGLTLSFADGFLAGDFL